MDAGQGDRGHRGLRGRRLHRRRDHGQEPALDHRVVHGADAAHHRQRDRARLVHPAAGARQHRPRGRRRQHLPRPRQRAGRHRRGPQPRLAARLLRPGRGRLEALVQGVGRGLRVDEGPLRLQGDDGEARHDGVALDRRRAREERADRPGQQPARGRLLGPRAELADARPGDEDGDGEGRPDGDHRPVPQRFRGDAGSPGGRVPAAGVLPSSRPRAR